MMTNEQLREMTHEELVNLVSDLQMTVDVYQGRCKQLEVDLTYSRKRAAEYQRQVEALSLDVAFLDRDNKKGIV
jgi:hypothetical protein